MPDKNGYLQCNDTLLVTPQPTYELGYNLLVESLRPFHPRIVRYVESGKLYSSATIILRDENREEVQQLPSGVYISRLPKMGILKNFGFKNPETGEVYAEIILEAFRHAWFNGLTVRDHHYSLKLLKELVNSRHEVAFALAAINPKAEGEREVKIRVFGTDKQLSDLLVELERIPLAIRPTDVMVPTIGKEGLGNDELHSLSV